MLDPKRVRESKDIVKTALSRRGQASVEALNAYIDADQKWRKALLESDTLKQKRNELTPKGKPTPEQLQSLKVLSDQVKALQDTLMQLESDATALSMAIPNTPDTSVPTGSSDHDNQLIRTVGTPSKDTWRKPHDEVAETAGLINFNIATQITGSRFSIYTGWGAKLERALINFMLDTHTAIHGYTEIMPPAIVNSKSLKGTGQLPKFADDLFKLEDTDYWLSPTSEVQLTNMYQNQIIHQDQLPIKYTAYTPCFRKEAGSHGKDIKGIIRQHQFNKIELVNFAHPDHAQNQLEVLVSEAEEILKRLELPYRTILLCSGDMGFSSAKTYDIEVWFPSQNQYREISSCSWFSDFQARRAMIRYRDSEDKVHYLHTLNGSGLAVGRTLAALLENYQNQDGSITVPDVLKPYMGVSVIPCKKK